MPSMENSPVARPSPGLAIAFGTGVGYNTARPMHDSKSPKKTDMHSEEFLRELMRKQLKLSITCQAKLEFGI
jgi:hypothetical protein